MTLEELRNEAKRCSDRIWQAARGLGRDPKIYLHWLDGPYDLLDSDYHICIKDDGSVHKMHPLDEIVAATYMRNTGSVSIAITGCLGAKGWTDGRRDLGQYPPTDAQIECMAQLVAVITSELGIPIDLNHVMTHAEAADNADGIWACEPYGPNSPCCERWDLAVLGADDAWGTGGDTIRGKALFYRNQGV